MEVKVRQVERVPLRDLWMIDLANADILKITKEYVVVSNKHEPRVSQPSEPIFGQWIDAKQLPPEMIRVICYCEGGRMEVGYIYEYHYCRDKDGDTFDECGYKVTKWMPLPKP